jgi:hypothetical protein
VCPLLTTRRAVMDALSLVGPFWLG